jgi:hypothetical protein
MGKIIRTNDALYEVLGTMKIKETDKDGTEKWKERWGADTILRQDNMYFFCRNILEAEWTDCSGSFPG